MDADPAGGERRAGALGGEVIVRPFALSGVARVALVVDAVGAQVGLWEDVGSTAGGVDG
jgi:predicted enzyme related to lactoylglutathione lyase